MGSLRARELVLLVTTGPELRLRLELHVSICKYYPDMHEHSAMHSVAVVLQDLVVCCSMLNCRLTIPPTLVSKKQQQEMDGARSGSRRKQVLG